MTNYDKRTRKTAERQPGLNNELLHLVAMLDSAGDPRDTRPLKYQALDCERDRLRALVDLQQKFKIKTPDQARALVESVSREFPDAAREWKDEHSRKWETLRRTHPNWAGWRDRNWWKPHLPVEDEPIFAVKAKPTLDDMTW